MAMPTCPADTAVLTAAWDDTVLPAVSALEFGGMYIPSTPMLAYTWSLQKGAQSMRSAPTIKQDPHRGTNLFGFTTALFERYLV
jgi:hypothetical protein